MRLNKVDLNLFVVFDVVYAEQNLSRAGEVLCLSQPAVSNALARLRKTFNDPLFVRSARGMTPTPLSENIIGPVREALRLLHNSVQEGETFYPQESQRVFRVSMTDMAESLLLPRLIEEVSTEAPGISIESYYASRSDVAKSLASGELDLALDVPLVVDPQLCHQRLIHDYYICAVRTDHPLAKQQLSLEQYLSLGHVNISSRRRGHGFVDLALHALGCQRNVTMRVPHYLVAPSIIARTDLALTVPRRWAEQFDLQLLELPFTAPEVDWHLYWHNSSERDQASIWLRQKVMELFGRP